MVMRTPRSLDIEITAHCNLRCRYCYHFDDPAVDYRDLPTGEWLRFFEELGSLGVMAVTLAGGEPFIREDLPALLNGLVANRMRYSILTNGSLVDERIAEAMASSGRCDFVQVSVDGSCAETHDACRGKGSFAGAMRGIDILRGHGVEVAVRVTVHRRNVNDLEAIGRLLLDELGLPSFSVNSAGYLGSCRLNETDVMLGADERLQAVVTLLRLAEEYDGRISAQAGPLADGQMWREMEEARTEGRPPFPNGGRLSACGCPTSKLAVRADGVMIPCTMLSHVELGRVNQDSLLEVWQNAPALERLRRRGEIPLREFELCKDCAYLSYCTGNCPALAYSLVGEIDHPSPDACLRRFLEEIGVSSWTH